MVLHPQIGTGELVSSDLYLKDITKTRTRCIPRGRCALWQPSPATRTRVTPLSPLVMDTTRSGRGARPARYSRIAATAVSHARSVGTSRTITPLPTKCGVPSARTANHLDLRDPHTSNTHTLSLSHTKQTRKTKASKSQPDAAAHNPQPITVAQPPWRLNERHEFFLAACMLQPLSECQC